jgi:hypothetical protein
VVTDNGAPSLSDTNQFQIAVVSRPVIGAITLTNGMVSLTWSALTGGTYRLQTRTNLTEGDWLDIVPDVSSTGPTASQSDLADSPTSKHYRVQVVP